MNDLSPAPVTASVLYLRLADFARQPVAEQVRLRQRLQAVAGGALGGLAPAERVVLDAADGLAIVVLDDPAAAMDIAGRCLAEGDGLALSIGADHGPVLPASDPEAQGGLTGDGIRSAQAAAGFAEPGKWLATRAFREALGSEAPAREVELAEAGTFADASVRTHELYGPDPQARRRRRLRLFGAGVVGAVALVASAALLRWGVPLLAAKPAIIAFEITPGGEVFVDGESRGTVPPMTELPVPAGPHSIEVRNGDNEPMTVSLDLEPEQRAVIRHRFPPPARLSFEVTPGGELWIDGVARGTLPGLASLELRSGRHRLQILHPPDPPLEMDLNLAPGEQRLIRHRFGKPPPAPSLINRIKRKLGIN